MKAKIDESQTFTAGRVKVTIKADPMEIELDPMKLIAEPAKAAAAAVGRGIRSVPESVRPSTMRRRERAGINSGRLFNATGKLAAGIRAERAGDHFEIVAPSDRLQDPELLERLAELVPELSDPFTDATAEKALEQAADDMITTRRRV